MIEVKLDLEKGKYIQSIKNTTGVDEMWNNEKVICEYRDRDQTEIGDEPMGF